MKFATIRDFRINASAVFNQLEEEQQEVVVTKRGKPIALLISVHQDQLETVLKEVRRIRFEEALKRSWANAKAQGTESLPMEKINAEIKKARQEKK